ncbi:hypothetical protein N9446_00240, partial [bacterium]|nr:hypothetical protein [bacterium]
NEPSKILEEVLKFLQLDYLETVFEGTDEVVHKGPELSLNLEIYSEREHIYNDVFKFCENEFGILFEEKKSLGS